MSLEIISIAEARKNKKDIAYRPVCPGMLGVKTFHNYAVKELIPYIDWTPFFSGWGLKGKYPGIFSKEKVGREARRIYEEGNRILDHIIENETIKPKGVIGIFPANSKGDDILVYEPGTTHTEIITTLAMLRQQAKHKHRDTFMSLSDFIAPRETGEPDYIGMFALTSGFEAEQYVQKLKKENDVYNSLMFRFIADRITEAFAERMHERVRKEFWAYAPDENLTNEELVNEQYQGTRPAPGYPACPDHSLKQRIFDILRVEERIGLSLTPEYVMKPVSAVCGFYLAHPESNYFGVGKICDEQLADYAKRNELPYSNAEKLLHASVVNKREHLIDKEN
ncbi:MAG: hypothetical protein GVY19_11450 [Bacteroidetes bacterium]|nr:hypothetical protein [Bacteroidota bacterium]